MFRLTAQLKERIRVVSMVSVVIRHWKPSNEEKRHLTMKDLVMPVSC